jgi:hypothetical protein
MFIGPLPPALRHIRDDGRKNEEIIAALVAHDVQILQKHVFLWNPEPIPPLGTEYPFLAVMAREVPEGSRASAEQLFTAVTHVRGDLKKPSLRSLLFLQEWMTRERLYADIVGLNEPVLNAGSGNLVLICLSWEEEEGISCIAAVDANHDPAHDDEMLLFLGPGA